VSIWIALVAKTALVFILVPALGAYGAAIATLVGGVAAGALCVFFVRAPTGSTINDYYSFALSDLTYLATLIPTRTNLLRRDDSNS
jgi:O-antigen/teichoic acid export membrane protein